MVAVLVALNVIVLKAEGTEFSHVRNAESGAEMNTRFIAPAAAFDVRPRL